MPPKRRLPDEVVAAFARWIADGAVWPAGDEARTPREAGGFAARHWAFERVKAVEPPPDPTGWSDRPIDRFIAARRRAAGLRPVRPADRRTLIRRVTFDLIGLPPTPEEVADFLERSLARTPSPGSSTACSPRRITASDGAGTGWTSPATPTPPATTPTIPSRKPPATATTSSTRSTATSRTTSSSASNWPATSWRGKESGDDYAESVVATGFLALSRRYATGAVRALAPDARRRDRDHRPRLPRADAPLRPLPRPQVRPGHPARLLRALRDVRQHDASLRRLGGVAVEGLPADEFRPARRAGAGRARSSKAYRRTARRARTRSIHVARVRRRTRRRAAGWPSCKTELIRLQADVAAAGPAGRLRRDRGEADRCRRSSGGAIPPVPGDGRPARRPSVRVPGRRAARRRWPHGAADGSSWRTG